jgi:hypothetical protein
MKKKTKPETELGKAAARALKRAAARARALARQHGTPIHVQSNGTVTALKP